MNNKTKKEKDFNQMLDVNTPIIYIQDYDFVRTDELIKNTIGENDVYEWNPANGYVNFRINNKESFGGGKYRKLSDILMEFSNKPKVRQRFLVLRDIQDYLDETKNTYDPAIKTALQLIALRKLYDRDFELTIIIVSSILKIPSEIEKYVSILTIGFPEPEEINKIIDEHIEENGYDNAKFRDKDRKELMSLLNGLTLFEIDRILDVAMSRNGSLSAEDKIRILEHKKQIVKKSGVLELIDSKDKIEDIGGLEILKEYLKKKKEIINNLEEAKEDWHITVPKGIFIVGMPGCGKSLCAKVTASLFNVPLLKMDMGSLMGKYVGQSEENIRKAIKIAEAASPCVLWIDEIEKMFSGIGEHNDILTRMFGYFLSWLQEKTSSVYVIATANNATDLPPELKRKGRFDEIFCVKLPNKDEIKDIFITHLRKRKQNLEPNNKLINLAKEKGFSGADIESVINEALEQCFIEKKKQLTIDKLIEVAENAISISDSCKEQIDKMNEAFENSAFKNASKEEK